MPTTYKPVDKSAAAPPAPEPVNVFATEWMNDLPLEARTGSYGPTCNDRWHGRTFDVPDGTHPLADGWHVTFLDGRFTGALQIAEPQPESA